ASPAVVEGAIAEIAAILSLPSGYHRDLQATKAPLLRAMSSGLHALSLVDELVRRLSFDEAKMAAAVSSDIVATDRAVELTREGVPFRTAYQRVAEELAGLEGRTAAESLAARVSPGAPGKLLLEELRARLQGAKT